VAEVRAADSMDAWMKHADEALYAAKNSGRNRVARSGPQAEPPAGRAATSGVTG